MEDTIALVYEVSMFVGALVLLIVLLKSDRDEG